MKSSRLVAAAVALAALVSISLVFSHTPVVAAAQASAPTPAPAQAPPHDMPAPTNLKVLPRNLTGQQVHEIMHQWSGELGTGCKTCHTVDPKNVGPDGKPAFNFADDKKEEKQTARLMYKMTEEINANYVSKIDSSGAPVTCGTCHRGHLGPEVFVPKPPHEHEPPPAPKPAM